MRIHLKKCTNCHGTNHRVEQHNSAIRSTGPLPDLDGENGKAPLKEQMQMKRIDELTQQLVERTSALNAKGKDLRKEKGRTKKITELQNNELENCKMSVESMKKEIAEMTQKKEELRTGREKITSLERKSKENATIQQPKVK